VYLNIFPSSLLLYFPYICYCSVCMSGIQYVV
jgi:hypothetical protein